MTAIQDKQIRCIFLDVDGTLVDSNNAHVQAWLRAFEEAGHTVSDALLSRCIGMGSDKLVATVARIDNETEEGKKITQRHDTLFEEQYLTGIQAFAKVRQLLEQMAGRGLMLIVVTSGVRESADKLLTAARVDDIIDAVVTSADARNTKPDPDIILAALERENITPDEALMFGDTPYDIEAAQKAGVKCVAVCSGGWSENELREAGAIAVYQDTADVLAHFDDSPFGKARPVGG